VGGSRKKEPPIDACSRETAMQQPTPVNAGSSGHDSQESSSSEAGQPSTKRRVARVHGSRKVTAIIDVESESVLPRSSAAFTALRS